MSRRPYLLVTTRQQECRFSRLSLALLAASWALASRLYQYLYPLRSGSTQVRNARKIITKALLVVALFLLVLVVATSAGMLFAASWVFDVIILVSNVGYTGGPIAVGDCLRTGDFGSGLGVLFTFPHCAEPASDPGSPPSHHDYQRARRARAPTLWPSHVAPRHLGRPSPTAAGTSVETKIRSSYRTLFHSRQTTVWAVQESVRSSQARLVPKSVQIGIAPRVELRPEGVKALVRNQSPR